MIRPIRLLPISPPIHFQTTMSLTQDDRIKMLSKSIFFSEDKDSQEKDLDKKEIIFLCQNNQRLFVKEKDIENISLPFWKAFFRNKMDVINFTPFSKTSINLYLDTHQKSQFSKKITASNSLEFLDFLHFLDDKENLKKCIQWLRIIFSENTNFFIEATLAASFSSIYIKRWMLDEWHQRKESYFSKIDPAIKNSLFEFFLTKTHNDECNFFSYFIVAKSYELGIGTKKNELLAVEIYKKAAFAEDSFGRMKYGECLLKGLGVLKNPHLALEYFSFAKEQGSLPAEYFIGKYYLKQGGEAHLQLALQSLENAATQNFPAAFYQLGNFFYKRKKDREKAFEYYSNAAKFNYAPALNKLGYFYQHKLVEKTKINESRIYAFNYYQQAADQEHKDAEYHLGFCYEEGFGTEENLELAYFYYRRAANKNHIRALYTLGHAHFIGQGVDENLSQSLIFFQKAANLGCMKSKSFLSSFGNYKNHSLNA